ncbi:hypothetical protein KAFR_0G01470 [Kazachstania africana CBS 2517]|uniref:N-terminal acetyltransferase B complex subunit MDM20 n=1 Tax=Kazachstania africana (strain ATCC 22294 / BCRC 22015 / CBS 2517 / CECT 1963 / NBRC 1671 / NRRL Y-8276) TaxID=1071382 RepID=H2AXT1_KAZAF|nr:hypothetical protein KAFR_0G01470 [Kazachstania africana CBS 2517]CCF59181.1 hypothetical protein KAFR_0G01470 [Kazachstania africana CBS 2517]
MVEKIEEDIFGLIRKSSFKQCFEKVNILKKNYPRLQYPNVLELYIKYKQSPLKFDYEADLGKLYGSNGSIVTVEHETLNLLHRFFSELENFEEALHVYEKANAKYPSFELSYSWFEKALEDSNYKHMAKASLQMSKFETAAGSLESRDFYFWNAISTIALFEFRTHNLTEQEVKILPLLTYKNLCNCKPFRSTQEVIVFSSVCEKLFPNDRSKSDDILKEITPHLTDSVDLYLKNFMLKHIGSNNPDLLFSNCEKMLNKINDYDLLKSLVTSGKQLGKSKDELINLIDSLLTDSRNSRLIRLEIDLVFDLTISEESLRHYLSKFHNKQCCSADLLHYKNSIDKDMLAGLISSFDDSDVIHASNIFKMKLNELDSVEYYNRHKNSLLEKVETDYSANSIFILDIVKSLTQKDEEPLIFDVVLAVSILENYQNKDSHNYDTNVWLIALYMYLGLVPLAYSHYQDLKVRNVQTDSMDFLLYSRYSSLFPQKQHDFIMKTLPEHDELYKSSLERLPQLINVSFERKAYSKILGMLDFRQRLEKSDTRWLKLSEKAQLARLCNDKRSLLLENLHVNWRTVTNSAFKQWSDNRDWSIFGPDIDRNRLPAVLGYMNLNRDWIELNILKEFMIESIPNNTESPKLDANLKKVIANRDLNEILSSSFTTMENWSFRTFYDLYSNNGTNLNTLLEELDFDKLPSGTWKLSSDYLTCLATLKTLDNFKRITDKKTKQLIKSNIQNLRDSCDERYRSYQKLLTQVCNNLKSHDGKGLLEKLEFLPLEADSLVKHVLVVQKAIRNL